MATNSIKYHFRSYFANLVRQYPALMWLAGINVLVWLAMQIARIIAMFAHLDFSIINEALLSLTLSADPDKTMHYPWSVITYMFFQDRFLHLLGNMIWLLFFAPFIYDERHKLRLVWIYLAGGVAGAAVFLFLGSGLLSNHIPTRGTLAGASAAVMAVMATSAMLRPNLPLRMMFLGEIKLKWIAIVCMLLTICSGGDDAGLAQAAHLAGGVAGVAAAIIIRRNDSEAPAVAVPKPAAHRTHGPGKPPPADAGQRLSEAMANRVPDSERLDQLLDKIRLSGYESLSTVEKRELNAISNRLKK